MKIMKNDQPNKGYIFRGTALEFFNRDVSNRGGIYSGNRFIADWVGAVGYSYKHIKEGSWYAEDPKTLTPCVICIDMKYAREYDHILKQFEMGFTQLSEVKVFKTDQIKGLEDLVEEIKTNPNPDIKEAVEAYGGWENYKKLFLEGVIGLLKRTGIAIK